MTVATLEKVNLPNESRERPALDEPVQNQNMIPSPVCATQYIETYPGKPNHELVVSTHHLKLV